MTNQTLPKNFHWMDTILVITGIILLLLAIILKNPNLKLGQEPIFLNRKEILGIIGFAGVFVAVMGGIAFPNADTHRKRSVALGIVIIGSAIVITSLLLKL
jgi:thiol:disulfide interchange protein